MKVIDVNRESFQEVEVKGHMALFTELRVDKSTIPEEVNCYELRHGDDDSYPAALEQSVRVNYFGAILMLDKMELGKEGWIELSCDDFGYTGREMKISELLTKECIPFMKASELIAFVDKNNIPVQMSEQEAEILLGYMDGHGCMIGHSGKEVMCMDICVREGEQTWKPYSIDDAVNDACNCNYDMILQAQQALESSDKFDEYEQVNARLKNLQEDEKVLDAMFDRTKYGKEVEQLSKQLANEFIRDMKSKDGIDGAIQRMTEAIKAGKDLLPDVSPALKKDTGAR